MKKLKLIICMSAFLLVFAGCDKDFVEINTDPYQITKIDPGLLFAGSQRIGSGGRNQIVQQAVNPMNTGATKGFNFNYDSGSGGNWSSYSGSLKTFSHILDLINNMPEEEQANYVNMRSIVRIWQAYVYMNMVDQLGNVPYFDALKAYSVGQDYFYPKYDDAKVIYEELEKELREALAALNPNGDLVSADLFWGINGAVPSNSAATQVEHWKKLGNSILLRMGMRYSRYNPATAERIVKEAFAGGVILDSKDNVFVTYDGTLFYNSSNNGLVTGNVSFNYVAEPFVDQLKNTNDPRGKYLLAKFDNPGNHSIGTPNFNLEEQYGLPVGVDNAQLVDPELMALYGYRGAHPAAGFDYSQWNTRAACARLNRDFWWTSAQNLLLLAEAAHRGWIPGGDAQAKEYYEDAIRADMDIYELLMSDAKTGLPISPSISEVEKNTYLAHPDVAYDPANALKLINVQYWLICVLIDGEEAWCNFKRTGYPELKRNDYTDDFWLGDGSFGDGFPRRYKYPNTEMSRNSANYWDAVEAIGGKDDNYVRIFWDPK